MAVVLATPERDPDAMEFHAPDDRARTSGHARRDGVPAGASSTRARSRVPLRRRDGATRDALLVSTPARRRDRRPTARSSRFTSGCTAPAPPPCSARAATLAQRHDRCRVGRSAARNPFAFPVRRAVTSVRVDRATSRTGWNRSGRRRRGASGRHCDLAAAARAGRSAVADPLGRARIRVGGRADRRVPGCVAETGGRWRCVVVNRDSSAIAGYRVRTTDGSCWTGELTEPVGAQMPRRISGCVLRSD